MKDDLQPEETITLVRAVKKVVRGNSRGKSGPGKLQFLDFLKFLSIIKWEEIC